MISSDKQQANYQRAHRVRSRLTGTSDRPRLVVHISLRHISAQLIDDTQLKTLAAITTVGSKQTGNLTDKAKWVGEQIAVKAKKINIGKVVFDRGPKIYHGRIKALAEAARAAGLEF